MRFLPGVLVLLGAVCCGLVAQSSNGRNPAATRGSAFVPEPPPDSPSPLAAKLPGTERLTFDVEWRLIHAGAAIVETQKSRAEVKLESAGLVSTLFKVNDTYMVEHDDQFCAANSSMDAQEGKRHRQTTVIYGRPRGKAAFVQRDLIRNSVIRSSEVDIPSCVQDVVSALLRLRTLNLEPGQSTQFPVSDGRRSASVKIDAQEREDIKTESGNYKTIRYEAGLMNNVVYERKGSVLIWVSDDAQRLPVQIRIRLSFPFGSVTLQLQKAEHF